MRSAANSRLLGPGRDAEWAQINREEADQDARFAAKLSVSERLELGQRLSSQAFELINAVRAGGNGPPRDPRA